MIRPGLQRRGASIALRAAGLGSRFLLMAFLARFGSFSTIGMYGLIYAVPQFVAPALSFGLHFRMNRHLVTAPLAEVGQRLRDRLILHLIVFALVAGVAAAVAQVIPGLSGARLGNRVIALAGLATLGELLLGEIHLVLLAIQRPLTANIVFFVRSGLWVGPFIVTGIFARGLVGIAPLLAFWVGSQAVAMIVFVGLCRDWPWRRIVRAPVEIGWLVRQPVKASSIWLGDIGNAAGAVTDRFVLGLFVNTTEIGVYTFLWTLANGTYQLVLSGVVQAGFARFCQKARANDIAGFRRLFRGELASAFGTMVILAGLTALAMPLLAHVLHKVELTGRIGILVLLLAAFTVRSVADVVNYGLYAVSRDRALATINIALTPLVLAMDAAGAAAGGIGGVALAVLLTFAVVLAARAWCLRDHLAAITAPGWRLRTADQH